MKRLLLLLLLIMFLVIPSYGISEATSGVLFESYTENKDGNTTFYNDNYIAQTFLVDEPHSVSTIKLPLQKIGEPNDITLRLKEGIDGSTLDTTIISSDIITSEANGTWVSIDLTTTISLEEDTTYAIQLETLGNTTDTIMWFDRNTAPLYDYGSKYTSSDGGLNWTEDTGSDFLFQIYGAIGMYLHEVKVFDSFQEDNDWLITMYYINTTEPYYSDGVPERYFRLKLKDGNSTIAESVIRRWDANPGSIYIGSNLASSLEWKGNYTVSMEANYGANYTYSYPLSNSDWIGSSVQELDSWCLHIARVMGVYYQDDKNYYLVEAKGKGEVLSAEVSPLFNMGIPGLSSIRGDDLFETSVGNYLPTTSEFDDDLQQTFDLETQVGSDLHQTLERLGAPLNLSSKSIGFIIVLISIASLIAVAVPTGHADAGLVLGTLVLLVAMIVGVVDVAWVALGGTLCLIMTLWYYVLGRT